MNIYTYVPPQAAPAPAPQPSPASHKPHIYTYVPPTQRYHRHDNTAAPHYHHAQYIQQPQLTYHPPQAAAVQVPAAVATEHYTHHHWHGVSKAQVDAENIAIAQKTGVTKPVPLVPYKPSASQQWWCRELDGSYTLRNTNDIMENLQPGFWQYAQPGGYPYFIRQEKQ